MGAFRTAVAATILAIAPVAMSAAPLDPATEGASATFSITHQTQVPGEVLKPGDYSIQIVEHISDRMIVRIDNVQGKEHVLFLGVPNLDGPASNTASGVQTWHTGAGSLPTLRGFNFPSGTAVDFVYPKAEAAALAKANAATVIAVDPESEGRPTKLKDLTSDDMREINLWMLTLTSTGPNDHKVPALEAKHYQPRSAAAAEVAASAVPAPTAAKREPQTAAAPVAQQTQIARADQPAVPQSATHKRRAVGTELPHTASTLPAVVAVGIASLLLAFTLYLRRTRLGEAL